MPTLNDFYVDCGSTYDGAPADTISGLWHLEGKTVHILADGAVHPPRVVVAGSITLQAEYSLVHIGLPYQSDLKTLPALLELAVSGQGMTKNINGAAVRFGRSSALKAGPSFARLTETPDRNASDPYDSAPELRTGTVRFAIGPSWNMDGQICVRQDLPLPLTVMALALDVAPGG